MSTSCVRVHDDDEHETPRKRAQPELVRYSPSGMLLLVRYSFGELLLLVRYSFGGGGPLLFRYSFGGSLLLVRYSFGGGAPTRPLLVRGGCSCPGVL